MYKQYNDLIRLLKENGALLNTIRPEFLLKYQEFSYYLKQNPMEYLAPSSSRINEKSFTYLSQDAWITLFFQIMKIYYLGRVTLKSYKSTPGMPIDKLNLPDYYMEPSNLISQSEVLLIRWMEVHYETVRHTAHPRRISNFEEDLRDGHVFAAIIQSYVGANCSRALSQLRGQCQNEDDYTHNCKKILEAMGDIGL